jgi:MFS family permease
MEFLGESKLLGVKASFLGLALASFVGTVVSGPIGTRWCQAWGTKRVWYFNIMIMLGTLACSLWAKERPWLAVIVTSISGIAYSLCNTTVFLLLQTLVQDEAARGFYIALANNVICFSQIIVAASTGLIVTAVGGNIAHMLAWVSAWGAVCLCVVGIVDCVCGIPSADMVTQEERDAQHVDIFAVPAGVLGRRGSTLRGDQSALGCVDDLDESCM